MRFAKRALVVIGALLGAPAVALAGFSAPIVQCGAVAAPAALSNCGSDPLIGGVASITDDGELDVAVTGAGAGETYTIVFRSPDGTQNVTITNNFVTGARGNGDFHREVQFALGKAGAGSLVITRGGQDQFLTGIAVEQSGADHAPPNFHARFSKCGAINIFANPLSNCGSDPLTNGQAEVDATDGDVNLQVTGAAANSSYDAVLRDPSGNTVAFGPLSTDSHGNGQLTMSATFAAGSISAGTFVLARGGSDQFLGGFRVTEKPRPRPAAGTGLVRCVAVNYGGGLANCGTDPLHAGAAVLSRSGSLSIHVQGAAPSTSYEVFFRPLDSDGSADIDTGIALATDSNGNAHGTRQLPGATSGTVGAGTFVVKGGGLDQFVGGFLLQ